MNSYSKRVVDELLAFSSYRLNHNSLLFTYFVSSKSTLQV